MKNLLSRSPLLWRGRDVSRVGKSISTGYVELDDVLPDSGWPVSSIIEVMVTSRGIGELQLFMPAMSCLSDSGNWLVWIEPPYLPYAPALQAAAINLDYLLLIQSQQKAGTLQTRDILWSAEKVLRTPGCGMVLLWPGQVRNSAIRRLQLAATAGQSIGILFRPLSRQTSPAALRLMLAATETGLQVDIVKAKGTCRRQTVGITL